MLSCHFLSMRFARALGCGGGDWAGILLFTWGDLRDYLILSPVASDRKGGITWLAYRATVTDKGPVKEGGRKLLEALTIIKILEW